MAENEGERQWIVEPPAPGEVSLHIAFGDGVQLTREQEAAVGDLLKSLESVDPEVAGLTKCGKQGVCDTLRCRPVNCNNLKCGVLTTQVTESTVESWTIMGSFGGIA